MSPSLPRLRICLLGGFEVSFRGRPIVGFESRKTRALLAYLVLNRERASERGYLAGLLWPEVDDDTALRNLRQAVFNLRSSLPDIKASPHILVSGQTVRFNSASRFWLDVDDLLAASTPGPGAPGAVATRAMADAIELYRGEFLAGFYFGDCPEFEAWIAEQQERLRSLAEDVLRSLAEREAARGEPRRGIEHARRLVAMDPLSEQAHRLLLRLYATAGERGRAIVHFRELQGMLRRELGVEPLPETKVLYEQIVAGAGSQSVGMGNQATVRPFIPLVGRDDAFERLRECWTAVRHGRGQVTVVEGEEGVGKTRLVRSFLDEATAQHPALVLVGRSVDQIPQLPYRPVVMALRRALAEEAEARRRLGRRLPRGLCRLLTRVLPELECAGVRPARPPAFNRVALVRAVCQALRELAGHDPRQPGARPVVVFVDDLHWADPGTLDLLAGLSEQIAELPVWLLAACTTGLGMTSDVASRLAAAGEAGRSRVSLSRLDPASIAEIAQSLVGGEEAARLAVLCERKSGRLPIALAAFVNAMWDEGLLVPSGPGDRPWTLARDAERSTESWPADPRELIRMRLQRLPGSTRRLAYLASVVGRGFDLEILEAAENEHPTVLEIGLGLLQQRHLLRQTPLPWSPAGPGSGLPEAAQEGHRLDFDHDLIRRAIYGDLGAPRRSAVHREVALALARTPSRQVDGLDEDLAFHFFEGRDWEQAFTFLDRAAERAQARQAPRNARLCLDRAVESAAHLLTAAGEDAVPRWEAEIRRLRGVIQAIQE